MNNDSYKKHKAFVTVDAVVFGLDKDEIKVLLIKRLLEPFKDRWAIPGGFVLDNETLEEGVRRELAEETGIQNVYLEQLFTFGDPGRDPRGQVITVAYYALVNLTSFQLKADTDASDVKWWSLSSLPSLAFDHKRILEVAVERLKGKVRYQPIGFELLPKKFTLTQLQRLYEIVLGKEIDKRNFRKRINEMGILKQLDEKIILDFGRPATLYQFDRRKYKQLEKIGFNFEL